MTIDRATLLASLKLKSISKDIAGIGLVNIAELSVADNDAIRAACKERGSFDDFGLLVTVKAVTDDAGTPLLTEEDLVALREGSNSRVDVLVDAVMSFNRYIPDEAKN